MVKRTAAILVLSIFMVFRVEAFMVSFLVIETGLSEEADNPHSHNWEDALLYVFFDEGFIVSNADMLRLASRPSGRIDDIITHDLDAAREGGANYFVAVQLDYVQGVSAPRTVSFFVYRIHQDQHEMIYQTQMAGRTYRLARNETADLRRTVRGLVPHIRRR